MLMLFVVVATLFTSVAAKEFPAFIDSAKFERWSHFKDYGVPAVLGKDALNSAAIADGSCRFVSEVDGFYFWHYPTRVKRVLEALAKAPPTSNPSYFTLDTDKALRDACSDKGDVLAPPEYDLKSMASSVQNWYHALCAPESDPSWQNKFDPAIQPQQIALTSGFMCIVACDVAKGHLSADAMGLFANDPKQTRDGICATFPWAQIDFSKATSVQELASMTSPLLAKPCHCAPVQMV